MKVKMTPEAAQFVLQGYLDGWDEYEEIPIEDLLPGIARILGRDLGEIRRQRVTKDLERSAGLDLTELGE